MNYYYTINRNRQSKVGGHENSNKNLNCELRELAQQIKDLPLDSIERDKLLIKLMGKIFESKTLSSFSKYKYLPDFDNLYSEAKLRTCKYIGENINNYDPKRAEVMAWVNQNFKYKFFDAKKKTTKDNEFQTVSLDAIKDETGFEPAAPYEENHEVCPSYRKVVEEDKEGLLASTKLIYTNQKTNVKESLSLKKILLMLSNGKTRIDIHREFHIPIQSLYSFIQRNLKKEETRNYFEKYSR